MGTRPQKFQSNYSEANIQQMIVQCQKSGLSRRAFCNQNNLNYHFLNYWIRKKRKQEKYNSISGDFIPVNIKSTGEQPFAQIETGSGYRLQLYQSVSSQFLKNLLR